MKQNQDSGGNTNQSEGRIWTSYSDLFVTISVIFLVMFVFSTLRSSLTAFQSVLKQRETDSYLEGKLSDKKRERFQKVEDDLNDHIRKIDHSVATIQEKKRELDQLVENLNRRQKTVEELLAEQRKREALLTHLKDETQLTKEKLKLAENEVQRQKLNRQEFVATLEAKYQREIEELREKAKKKERTSQEKVAVLTAKNQQLNTEVQTLKHRSETQGGQIGKLQSGLQDTANQLAHYRNLNAKFQASLTKCETTPAKKAPSFPASVAVNPVNGKMTIEVDQSFFKNDSYQISDETKKMLKRVIPEYAESIYRNKKLWKRIRSIRVIGHASPRYGSKPVDPKNTRSKAYQYNLFLSQKRAENISGFIKSIDLRDSNYEKDFYSKIRWEGMSYSNPVLQHRSPAAKAKKEDGCGEYDCRRSRRVEIILELDNSDHQIHDLTPDSAKRKPAATPKKTDHPNRSEKLKKSEIPQFTPQKPEAFHLFFKTDHLTYRDYYYDDDQYP